MSNGPSKIPRLEFAILSGLLWISAFAILCSEVYFLVSHGSKLNTFTGGPFWLLAVLLAGAVVVAGWAVVTLIAVPAAWLRARNKNGPT
jgi:hypothetical protein